MFDIFIFTIGFLWLAILILTFLFIVSIFVEDISRIVRKRRKKRQKKNDYDDFRSRA